MDVMNEPTTEAGRRWAEMVRLEHEQADRVRSTAPDGDFWKGLAHRFSAATREDARKDETVAALLPRLRASDTVLDVGAGAGRIALPLAERCRFVTAVEPSLAMRERLEAQVGEWGLRNVRLVESTWEEADVEPADVVVCAHVLYTVMDIEPFIRKLTSHARREVAVVLFEEPAMHAFFPLWKAVHGEDRLKLPCLPELRAVLDEMGIGFQVHALPQWPPRPVEGVEQAMPESMARLFIAPGTPQAERLRHALGEALTPVEGGYTLRWAKPHRPHLITWAGTAN